MMIIQSKQDGAALILFFMAVFLAVVTSFVLKFTSNMENLNKEQQTLESLVLARDALINYAVTHDPAGITPPRPGSLPCPDNTNDGLANVTGTNCDTQLGWLPFRTLGLDDIRDRSGERLWYAVDPFYQENNGGALNSEIAGTLFVDGNPGFMAVVLAPGQAVAAVQNTRTPNDFAGTGDATASFPSYLERINSDGDFSTYSSTGLEPFNDQLIAIGPRDLLPRVEQRVARELRNELRRYMTICANLPNPPAVPPGDIQPFPLDECTFLSPTWILSNGWNTLAHYDIAPNGVNCGVTPPCLTVTGWPNPLNHQAVIIVAGQATVGQIRPSTALVNLLDNAENLDGDTNFQAFDPLADFNNQNDIIEVYP